MERTRKPCVETTEVTAAATIDEAQGMARRIVESERGKFGGNVPRAIDRVSSLYGVERGPLQSLWERRERKTIAGHILDRLRQVDAYLAAKAEREREIAKDVAESLERRGHPAAGLARKIAEMADPK